MTHRNPSFLTLLLLISFASVNAVLYTPALPAITEYFGVTSDMAQQTITIFLLGYTVGQLIYGPIANRFGRVPAVFVGAAIQILSSLGCVLAAHLNSFELFYAARFMTAIGSGVGLKITFTLVNEFYPAKIASQKISYLVLIFAIAPGLSVTLGGLLTQYLHWISCFYFLAAYGLFVMFLAMKLPETKTILDLDAFKWKHMLKAYFQQIKIPRLMAAGLFMGGCTAVVYLFATLAPFIAIDHYGMSSAEYGFANLLPSVGMFVGGICSAHFVKTVPMGRLISIGIPIMCLGISLFVLGAYFEWPPLWSLFIPAMVTFTGNGMVYGNISTLGLQATHDKAHGSSIMNFINIGIGTLAVFSLSLHSFHPRLVLPLMALLCGLLILTNLKKLRD